MNEAPPQPVFRFSLLSLFLLTAMVGIFLWMWRSYGLLVFILFAPLLVSTITSGYFWVNGRRKLSAAIVTIYALAWFYSAILGTKSLCRQAESGFCEKSSEFLRNNAMRKLTEDPLPNEKWRRIPAPWYHIQTSSPCPFVVCVDFSVKYAPMDSMSGKSYYLWFAGHHQQIFFQFRWSS